MSNIADLVRTQSMLLAIPVSKRTEDDTVALRTTQNEINAQFSDVYDEFVKPIVDGVLFPEWETDGFDDVLDTNPIPEFPEGVLTADKYNDCATQLTKSMSEVSAALERLRGTHFGVTRYVKQIETIFKAVTGLKADEAKSVAEMYLPPAFGDRVVEVTFYYEQFQQRWSMLQEYKQLLKTKADVYSRNSTNATTVFERGSRDPSMIK